LKGHHEGMEMASWRHGEGFEMALRGHEYVLLMLLKNGCVGRFGRLGQLGLVGRGVEGGEGMVKACKRLWNGIERAWWWHREGMEIWGNMCGFVMVFVVVRFCELCDLDVDWEFSRMDADWVLMLAFLSFWFYQIRFQGDLKDCRQLDVKIK
jgi:hypothetical protein